MDIEYPGMIQIESSTACNGKCVFCPTGRGIVKRLGGTMSDELFMKIVNETMEIPTTNSIILFLNGEPFLFSRFFEWLDVLLEKGIHTTIYTNGSMIDEVKANKLLDYQNIIDRIIFSVPGKDTKTYYENTGLSFDTVYNNVKQFGSINNNRIPTTAHTPNFSGIISYMEEWLSIWKPLVNTANPTAMYNWAGDIEDSMITQAQKSYCGRLNVIHVLWDGRVCLCCMDADGKIILGDANKHTMIEIYNNARYRMYRDMHRQGKWDQVELCDKCNMNI